MLMSINELKKLISNLIIESNEEIIKNWKNSKILKELESEDFDILNIESVETGVIKVKYKTSFFNGNNNFIFIVHKDFSEDVVGGLYDGMSKESRTPQTAAYIAINFIGHALSSYSEIAKNYFNSNQIKAKIKKASENIPEKDIEQIFDELIEDPVDFLSFEDGAKKIFNKCLTSFRDKMVIRVGGSPSNYDCNDHPVGENIIAHYDGSLDLVYIPAKKMFNHLVKKGGLYAVRDDTITHELTHRHLHVFENFNDLLLKGKSFTPEFYRASFKDGSTKYDIANLNVFTQKELNEKAKEYLKSKDKFTTEKYNRAKETIQEHYFKGLYNITLDHIAETCIRINMLATLNSRKVNDDFILGFLDGEYKIPSDLKDLKSVQIVLKKTRNNLAFLVDRCNSIAKAQKQEKDTEIV